MIGLHPADRHQRIGIRCDRVGDDVFQLAQLVAAERKAGIAVLALGIDLYAAAEMFGQAGEVLDRRGPEGQGIAGKALERAMSLAKNRFVSPATLRALTRSMCRAVLLWCMLVAPFTSAWAQAGPVFSGTGPDAAGYGAGQGYPARSGGVLLPQQFMVGSYSRYETVNWVHTSARAATPSVLHRAPAEISLTWRHVGVELTLDDYLRRNPTTGLLIAHGDTILFEHYQYGRTDHDRLLSQSMAKTVTAMLIGIALSEGAIRSLDQPASDYVSGLAGTAYGETTLRNLLHMASGVAFTEVYDGTDDNAKLVSQRSAANGAGAVRALAGFNEREAPQGTRFHYASSESQVLGLVLSAAVHMPLAAYLESRIWQPMGAEAAAVWGVDRAGLEVASCCLNAVLRDWTRFALLLAHDGMWNGRQIIPRQWVLDATTPAAPFLAPAVAPPRLGYGYQVWLQPGARRQFSLRGVHGQAIFVDPQARLVLVHTAVRVPPANDPQAAELAELWRALVARYGS
jgi:CubicO group peptidase (beta-lactamase class C family)